MTTETSLDGGRRLLAGAARRSEGGNIVLRRDAAAALHERLEALEAFASRLARMDDPADDEAQRDRQSITLTQIVEAAAAALRG